MFSFLKLIRVQNLLIIAFTQCMVRWCIVYPILKVRGMMGGLITAAYGARGLMAPFARARRTTLLSTSAWGVAAVVLIITLISVASSSLLLILGAILVGLLAGASFLSSFGMPEIEREPGFE